MLKKLKGFAGNLYRGFQGIYQARTDREVVLPENLDVQVIGESREGREISAYKFGSNGKIKILFMGGIHGNEVGTVKLMYKLIGHLHKHKYLGLEVYVLPCLNPDGMTFALSDPEYFKGGRRGRFNASGVDLNLNFECADFESENHWYFGNSYVTVQCGDKPFSEPESKALADFVLEKEISILYSFHSRGREIMGSRDELAQRLTKDFVVQTGYRYVDDDSWQRMQQTGTVKQWCEDKGISYVEIENATRYGSDWKNQKNAIISALKYHYG